MLERVMMVKELADVRGIEMPAQVQASVVAAVPV